jgi:hypothetical protein
MSVKFTVHCSTVVFSLRLHGTWACLCESRGANPAHASAHTHMDVAVRAMMVRVRELDPPAARRERVATGSKDAYPADRTPLTTA